MAKALSQLAACQVTMPLDKLGHLKASPGTWEGFTAASKQVPLGISWHWRKRIEHVYT